MNSIKATKVSPSATMYQPDRHVFAADKAELRVQEEKRRAEMKENAALREKALLQQKIHDQDIQRHEQAKNTERLTLTLTITSPSPSP